MVRCCVCCSAVLLFFEFLGGFLGGRGGDMGGGRGGTVEIRNITAEYPHPGPSTLPVITRNA